MSGVLFVSHDAGGTVPPMIALAEAMLERGHDVTVLGQPSIGRPALAIGARFVPFGTIPDYDAGRPIEDQLDVAVEVITGSAPGDELLAIAEEHRSDVVVVDCNLAGALAAAETLDRRSVVLLHSMYRTFVDTWFGDLWPFLESPINATRKAFGLDPCTSWPDVFSRHDRMYSVVPRMFDAPVELVPPTMRHFGFLIPKLPVASEGSLFPSGDGKCVLVSLSTTYQHQERLLQAIVDALAEMDVRALVTTGGHGDELRVPANVVLRDYVPHQLVLPETDVVVTHGGLGTISGALSYGVPLVCTPIARDQPLNAERMKALGAGEATGLEPTSAEIRAAIELVLTDASHRAAAEALSRASAESGGPRAAADDLEGLIASYERRG